jgi:hypothetical protein
LWCTIIVSYIRIIFCVSDDADEEDDEDEDENRALPKKRKKD